MGSIEGDAVQHGVARPRFSILGRARASAGLALATAGHAGTFLALSAGSLWLAVAGTEALPQVQRIFVAGLYLQALPALGFALVARHLSAWGKPRYAGGAGALSLASMALLAVGTLQVVGSNGLQIAFLAISMVLMVGVGLGIVVGRVVDGFRDGFDDATPYEIEHGEDGAALRLLS